MDIQQSPENFQRIKKREFLESAVYNKSNYTYNSNYNREHEARRSTGGLSIYRAPSSNVTSGKQVYAFAEPSTPITSEKNKALAPGALVRKENQLTP